MPPRKASKEGPKLAEDGDADKGTEQDGAEQNGSDEAPELSDAIVDTKIKYLDDRLGKASSKDKHFANKLAEELAAAGKHEHELKVRVWALKALDAELKASDVRDQFTILSHFPKFTSMLAELAVKSRFLNMRCGLLKIRSPTRPFTGTPFYRRLLAILFLRIMSYALSRYLTSVKI